MKSKAILSILPCLALLALPAVAAPPEKNADQMLRQMSAKLAAARSFTFEATRELDAALQADGALPAKARVSVAVQRPNKLAARATSQLGTRRFVFDGRTLSLLDGKPNVYATVPMATSIDGLVEVLDAKYGFVPPLAEFAVSNPYAELVGKGRTVTYLGRVKATGGFLDFAGTECHRIGLKGRGADAELWVAVGDGLPRKLVATFHRAGNPQVRVVFSKWNLAAPAADFTFTPPQGAEKTEMWTTAKMQAVR